MPTPKQLGVLAVGLFTSAGFFLGGISSFSGMVDTQPAQPDNQAPEAGELPGENFNPDGYNMDAEQMFMIAVENDVVFVNGLYESDEQRTELEETFEDMPETFGNRVYVGLENNESALATNYGVTDYPSALVIGGNQQAVPQPIEADEETVRGQVCDSFRELGAEIAAQC